MFGQAHGDRADFWDLFPWAILGRPVSLLYWDPNRDRFWDLLEENAVVRWAAFTICDGTAGLPLAEVF
jgi:hypothetical protein